MKLLFILIIIGALFILSLRAFEYFSIYHPEYQFDYRPDDINVRYEPIVISVNRHDTIHGWLFDGENKSSILIFAHGNAGNISHRLDKIQILSRLQFPIFIFDYRGYGKSKGRPSEKNLYQDMGLAVKYVRERYKKFDPNIILYGESLGGAVTIDYAVSNPEKIKALIVEDTFTSIVDMAKAHYPAIPRALIRNQFNSIQKVSRIQAPVLLLRCENDMVVPRSMSEVLLSEMHTPKKLLDLRGGHAEGLLVDSDRVIKELESFLYD